MKNEIINFFLWIDSIIEKIWNIFFKKDQVKIWKTKQKKWSKK
jgi:hypothetical protein